MIMDKRKVEVGDIICNKRNLMGLSMRELGKIVGVNHSEISRIENGTKTSYNLNTLIKICDVLDLNFLEILGKLGVIDKEIKYADKLTKYEVTINIISENKFEIQQIQKLLGKLPVFGICLGHQLMALANGASTYKLKYGHRGANQPVKDLVTGLTFITTQNHGYAVDASTLKQGKERFINANDGTCEGIDYPSFNSFSAQFHPEACAGPKDTEFLFDQFLKNMGVN